MIFGNSFLYKKDLPPEVALSEADSRFDETKFQQTCDRFETLGLDDSIFKSCLIDEDNSLRGFLKDGRLACLKKEGGKVFQYTSVTKSPVPIGLAFFKAGEEEFCLREFKKLPERKVVGAPIFLTAVKKKSPTAFLQLLGDTVLLFKRTEVSGKEVCI